MLSLTSVSASEDDIGDVADEFMLPCQRVHAMTVTVYVAAGIRTEVAGFEASRLDHSATTLRRIDPILHRPYLAIISISGTICCHVESFNPIC